MHLRTLVASIQDTTGAPEGPSRHRRSSGDAFSGGFKEVKFIPRSLIVYAAQEDQQDEQHSSGEKEKG